MGGSHSKQLLETMLSSGKASIAVILVLLYGYMLRRWRWIRKEGEQNISSIGTTFLLPALLFSEIGPLATPSNLRTYWPILPLSLFFQLISLGVGLVSHRFWVPQHFVPAFVFNNVTSLPLLLINALAQTGSLDSLIMPHDDLPSVLKRANVYILLNALIGNLTRFALGPFLMSTHKDVVFLHPHADDPSTPPDEGAIRLPETTEDDEVEPAKPHGFGEKVAAGAKAAWHWTVTCLNPPLVGGLAGIILGVIPWTQYELFDGDGWLSPIAQSIKSVGALYTALQMLVLGAHLFSKTGSSHTKAPLLILLWLFTYRFIIAPTISIATVYGLRRAFPTLITPDPVLDFILCLSNVGPPALTLSAIANMANLPSEAEGQIAQTLTLSYAVTPLIALSVTAALQVVHLSGVGR
ncbi:hypothetical protein BCR35DRAFT_307471 [Leucosporidium creatinivorum]|uniref:Auxin efflux carrier n=1 Tax=Leucosporidium creatinivorum TaxID=106004 RepID=A0A1Y2EMY9_9BASI|nr:hypothetical protein BCR35DRAFT_307471 [Leucosporidium creatinivorum]